MLVGLNFEFGCMRSQLALAELFFVFVDLAAGFANPADPVNLSANFLGPRFDFNVPNFSCFGKLTTMSFFMSSIFLALSSKFLISVK